MPTDTGAPGDDSMEGEQAPPVTRWPGSLRGRLYVGAAWAGFYGLQMALAKFSGNPLLWWQSAILYTTLAVVWTIMTPMIIQSLNGVRARTPSLPLIAITHATIYLVVVVVDSMTRRMVMTAVTGSYNYPFSATLFFFADMTASAYIATVVTADVVAASEAAARQQRYELALQGELTRAKLSLLQAQLQPHFLFNALSTVAELVATVPDKAVPVIQQLSRLFRYSVAARNDEVRLSDEIDIVLSYLEVQNLRFSDWISIKCHVSAEALNCLVPPLLLQPLIENAIRHGLHNRESPGEIIIRADVELGRLHLSVMDNGVGLCAGPDLPRLGIGLSNIRARLSTHYGHAAVMTLSAGESNGTTADLYLPGRRT